MTATEGNTRSERRILLTGSTGFVGSHTVRQLLRTGYKVRCLVRSTSNLSRLPKGVDTVEGHLLNYDSLFDAVEDCWGVVHCGGVVKVKRKRDFYLVNRDGTANLVKAARDQSVNRFLLCSSQAASGPSEPLLPVTPEDTPNPITEYGRSKLAGEEVLKSSAGDMRWCILRPPAVYGPSDIAFLPLIKSIKRGIKVRIGRGTSFSIIHVLDLARALVMALEVDHPSGATWFATDGNIYTDTDLTEAIELALNKRAYTINIPYWTASLAARLNEKLAQLRSSDVFLDRDKLIELTQPYYTCDDRSFRKATGFQPEYDLKSGMLQTVEWHMKRGLL